MRLGTHHTPQSIERCCQAQRLAAARRREEEGAAFLTLPEIVARSGPDECPFCGEPRAEQLTKPNLTCGEPECKKAYQTYYGRERRRKEREERERERISGV